MITLKAERLFYFPIKGCAGVEAEALTLSPAYGVLFDRRFAFALDETPAAGDHVFRKKANFLHGMRWPQTVRLKPEVGAAFAALAQDASDDASDDALRDALLAALRLQETPEGPPRALSADQNAAEAAAADLLEAGAARPRLVAGRFPDREPPFVSVINLDTLDAFAAYVGAPEIADPRRWRCNAYVRAGLGAEYAWARDRAELAIGGATLTVQKLLGRCAMITAEPAVGRKDHPDLMAELRRFEQEHGFEHPEERAPVMGVLATPNSEAKMIRAL